MVRYSFLTVLGHAIEDPTKRHIVSRAHGSGFHMLFGSAELDYGGHHTMEHFRLMEEGAVFFDRTVRIESEHHFNKICVDAIEREARRWKEVPILESVASISDEEMKRELHSKVPDQFEKTISRHLRAQKHSITSFARAPIFHGSFNIGLIMARYLGGKVPHKNRSKK